MYQYYLRCGGRKTYSDKTNRNLWLCNFALIYRSQRFFQHFEGSQWFNSSCRSEVLSFFRVCPDTFVYVFWFFSSDVLDIIQCPISASLSSSFSICLSYTIPRVFNKMFLSKNLIFKMRRFREEVGHKATSDILPS